MKAIGILMLLLSAAASGQNYAIKKDGSKVPLYSFHVSASKKRIDYKTNSQEGTIAFSDLDSIVEDKKVLKRFDIGKKPKLYYVLASDKGKTLGVTSSKRNKERGGFSSVVTRYEVVVIEKGNILKTLTFTESMTDSQTQKRNAFFDLVAEHFNDCLPLPARAHLFVSDSDPYSLTILNYLDNPERLHCK